MPRLTLHHLPITIMQWGDSNPVGAGTDYPYGISIEKLFKWFFRVKTWKIEVTGVSSSNNGDMTASVDPSAMVYTQDGTILSEEFLTTSQPATQTSGGAGDGRSDSHGQVGANCNATINLFSSVFRPVIKKDDLYYPSFYIIGACYSLATHDGPTGGGGGQANTVAQIQTFPDYTPTQIAAGTLSNLSIIIDGLSLTIPYLVTHVSDGGGLSADAAITTFKISPDKYWPHDNGHGPAYDEDTGAYLL